VFGFQDYKKKFHSFGVTHNWVKQSIFGKLPYWKTNLLCHNLDCMHIKKNMFGNIFNTMIDMKGKTKDNIKARMSIPLFFLRKNIELVYDGQWVPKPKASCTLDNNTLLLVYQWLKSLCFPDGYASNILDWWI